MYYNLLIRAFTRKWVTHAEVSTRGIQIHLNSKMCSTHFVEGCFREHRSTLSFSCSQPSQTHLIFSTCLSLMPSSGMRLCTCNYPCSCSHSLPWVLLLTVPPGDNYDNFQAQNELLGLVFCFLSTIPALFFFFPLCTTLTPQRRKKLVNSSQT